MTNAEIFETLRKARKERGKTLEEVAKATGRTKQAMSSLENGHYNPTLDTLQAVAEAVGVEIELRMKQPRER